MRIAIFANGILDDPKHAVEQWLQEDDVIVAADGGTHHVLTAGLRPHHVIGDLDSLSQRLREELAAQGTAFHPHPPAKDETDLELALLWAAEQAATRILILGALGGRPDQTVANLLLLSMPELQEQDVRIVDGGWEIHLLRGGETLTLTGAPGDRFSLLPLGGDADGVHTEGAPQGAAPGARYPLEDETLHFGPARGVSNVLEAEAVTITLERGQLWCFHEHEAKSPA
jgi:thiamine pyrophosphokinase